MSFRHTANRFRDLRAAAALVSPAPADVRAFHQSLAGYAPTPLVRLDALARELGVGSIWIKDESPRFGLGAFKVLGASYGIHRFLQDRALPSPITFATATDGNHGRAVAWTARRLGHRAIVYVPGHTVRARIDAIAREGAHVVLVDGTYDDAVRRAADDAAAHGWPVISDTAYPGYTEVPDWIMEGYMTLFDEAATEMDARGVRPDVVCLQAGVGGLACAGVRSFLRRNAPPPRFVVVEPVDADGLRESIASPDGSPREPRGAQRSIMAGLNCGLPSLAAWPLLRLAVDQFVAVDDEASMEAMRRLAESGVISGESGAAGLAGLIAIAPDVAARHAVGLSAHATVLVISTEGATDPASWSRICGRPWPAG